MPRPVSRLVRQLGRSAALPDTELLRRYAEAADAEAFAELVRRHGRMVLAACRRVLRDTHAAEDAFQAVFFALARRPEAVRDPAALPAWLHGTAVRAALRLRRAVRRPRHDRDVAATYPDPAAVAADRDRLGVLDEELARLPEALRLPLVLCYLEGRTRDEASESLGCSLAMVKRRLERGRNLLRDRLARRGVTLPAAGVGMLATDIVVRAAEVMPRPRAATAYPRRSGSRRGGTPWRPRRRSRPRYGRGPFAFRVGSSAGGQSDEKDPQQLHLLPEADARADQFATHCHPASWPAWGQAARLPPPRRRDADSKTVVTAGEDLVVRTFDTVTGDARETRTLDGPPAYHTVLSADGRYLAGVTYPAPEAAELRVWDLTTGKQVGHLPLGKDPASALAIHAGTTKVAFIRGPYTVPPSTQKTCLWDFAANTEPTELRGFKRAEQT